VPTPGSVPPSPPLAAEGVRLALMARRDVPMRALAEQYGATTIPCDIIDADALDQGADAAMAALGKKNEVWDRSMALNFIATRRLTERLLPAMRRARKERVISLTGTNEIHASNPAGSAKAALTFWSKEAVSLVAIDGVILKCTALALLWSEQIRELLHAKPVQRGRFIADSIPPGRFGEPEELASVAVFLASIRAASVIDTAITVDGDMALAIC